MKYINFKKVIFLAILGSALFLGIFCYNYFSIDKKEANSAKNSIDNRNMFAILLENSDGTYSESSDNTWPTSGYVYNSEKSGCVDGSGNPIEGILSFDTSTKIATVDTDQTTYCYLYFSKTS